MWCEEEAAPAPNSRFPGREGGNGLGLLRRRTRRILINPGALALAADADVLAVGDWRGAQGDNALAGLETFRDGDDAGIGTARSDRALLGDVRGRNHDHGG